MKRVTRSGKTIEFAAPAQYSVRETLPSKECEIGRYNDLSEAKAFARGYEGEVYILSDGIRIWDNTDGDNVNIFFL